MRNKKLIIGIVIAVAFIGFILITKTILSKAMGRKPVAAAKGAKDIVKAPLKKVISKGKAGLTVKILNSKNMEIPIKIRAFKVIDGRSSVYASSSVGGRMQEVAPGTYDIEVDTVPQKIFKNIKAVQGRENVENLGCVTGSLIIKTVNSKKAAAFYPMRILYPNAGDMVTAYMTNKAIEIIPGVYDIEIGTSPRQYKKGVRVDAGKEVVVDLGCVAGTILVKTVDEHGKDVRCSVKIMRSNTMEVISSTASNKPIEIGKGSYNIDILSYPKQSKKAVSVNAGEESVVKFVIKSAPAQKNAPQKPPAKANQ
jgi:hypothetical protein